MKRAMNLLLLVLPAVGVTATLLWAQHEAGDRKPGFVRPKRGYDGEDRPPPPFHPPKGKPFPPPPLMKALDTDRDGVISAKEMENAPRTLKELDGNRDGKLTEKELRPKGPPPFAHGGPPKRREDRPEGKRRGPPRFGPPQRHRRMPPRPEERLEPQAERQLPPPAERIMALDINNDGKVTVREVPDNLRKTFERFIGQIDTNRDDAVDREELERAFRPPHPARPNRPHDDRRPPRHPQDADQAP